LIGDDQIGQKLTRKNAGVEDDNGLFMTTTAPPAAQFRVGDVFGGHQILFGWSEFLKCFCNENEKDLKPMVGVDR
jgi:hypothetical protein